MTSAVAQTVQEWQTRGYRGLRIPRCPTCGHATERTWEELAADVNEPVIEVARRICCRDCRQVPAGLAVVTYGPGS